MTGSLRRLAAVTVLAATMVSFAAPAFAACSCAPCRKVERVAATRVAGSQSCPGCHTAVAVTGERISAASCCSARALVDAPAVSPAPVQVERPAPLAPAAILPVADLAASLGDAAASRPFVDVSPPPPQISPHLSSLLRL